MAAWNITWPLVLKIFHSIAALTREIFFNTRREISLSPSGHVISSISLKRGAY